MKINEIITESQLNERIRKVESGYRLLSRKGKNLGTFPTRAAAEKHEREVQYFKHANEGVEGLNEFAPDGFNGGGDGDAFSPEIAKMAQEDGFTKGAGLADGATLERAITINHWHSQHGGMYKQYFAKGFKAGRMNKINHDNKQYKLNLKLMKDGSIRHSDQSMYEGVTEDRGNPGEYVYHASYMPDLGKGLRSVASRGLVPNRGQAGVGVYFAYDPEGGFYHVDREDATMFRVKWSDLVKAFGKYPQNPDGIQRDNDEIIVPGRVPASMMEVEYFPGEWWDIESALRTEVGMDEDSADGVGPSTKMVV